MKPLVVDAKWAFLTKGGVARMTEYLCQRLLERLEPARVSIVAPRVESEPVRIARESLTRLPWRGRPRWAHLLYDQVSLRRHLRRVGACVFLTPHVEHPWKPGVPLLSFVYDLSSLDRQAGRSAFNYFYYSSSLLRSVREASLLATISSVTADQIRSRWPDTAARLIVVEAAVAALDSMGGACGPLSDEENFVLYTGGVHGRKRIDLLLQAMQLYWSGQGGNADLWMTGTQEAYAHVFPRWFGSTLPRVRFLGELTESELKALYRRAQVVVYLSSLEGYGLPVAEACLAGTPIICSDTPLLRKEHGKGPLYVRNEVEAVAAALDRVLSDEITRGEMAEASRQAGCRIRQSLRNLPGWTRFFDRVQEFVA